MRRVASGLGIATMSLYSYVPAKEHLVQLMIDQLWGEYAYPPARPAGACPAIAELARETRDIGRRHPWLPVLLHHPGSPGPNGLRYMDYFLGLLAGAGLDTGAKMEVIALITGFAVSHGGMQAPLATERGGTATSAQERADAQIRTFARAAGSGLYPNLAAALAEAGPARGEDDIFESCILRLIEVARPAQLHGGP